MIDVTFIILLLLSASGIFSLYRQLKTLQQNSYSVSGYFKWFRESYTIELAVSAVLYCVITIGIIKGKTTLALVLAIALTLLRIILNFYTHKKAAKKLAFTARVKRLYIAAILILGALILACTISSNEVASEICRTLCLMLSIVTPMLTFVVWGVTYPLEKALRRSNRNSKNGR